MGSWDRTCGFARRREVWWAKIKGGGDERVREQCILREEGGASKFMQERGENKERLGMT